MRNSLFLLVLLLNSFTQNAIGQVNEQDSLALVAFYESTDGANWTNNHNWLTGDVDTWYGVWTANGRVTEIQIGPNNLSGTLPQEIGSLTALKRLEISGNDKLEGQLPSSVSNLEALEWLILPGNQLEGAIPPEVGNLNQLTGLALSENQMVGSIPTTLGNLTKLDFLELSDNQLEGNIPIELGSLSNLRIMDLDNNLLSGSIPDEIGNLVSLEILDADGNELSGFLPDELGNLSKLEFLSIGRNQLSGSLPKELGNLSNLEVLQINDNNFSGGIPEELGNLESLVGLRLSSNQLAGSIPATLGNLVLLESLDVSVNQLTGSIPRTLGDLISLDVLRVFKNQLVGEIPLSYVRLEELTEFDFSETSLCEPQDQIYLDWKEGKSIVGTGLFCENEYSLNTDSLALVALYESTNGDNWYNNDNWLVGSLDSWFGITVGNDRVTSIVLQDGEVEEQCCSGNNLTGSIPAEIGRLTGLDRLSLVGSKLGGEIPSSIGNLSSLIELTLLGELVGSIPDEIGNLLNLERLELTGNRLSGEVPSSLGNLSNLYEVYLAVNQLNGTIPKEIGQLSSLRFLILESNNLSGIIPIEFGNLSNLNTLRLNDNKLGGSIPSELGSLENIWQLWLNNNRLTGVLPKEMGNMLALEDLRIDDNSLTGPIPLDWTGMTSLAIGEQRFFDFSNTNLCEPIDLIWEDWTQNRNIVSSGITCTNTDIYSFSINGFEQQGDLNFDNKTITLNLPEVDLASLIGVFEISEGARVTIADVPQISGVSTNDFTTPLIYAVASQDGLESSNWEVVITNEAIVNGIVESEYHALIDFYNATQGDNWTNSTNWLSQEPVDDWFGVEVIDNRVSKLTLNHFEENQCCLGNNLRGILTPSLGQLINLQELKLRSNRIGGNIPEQIGDLSKLQILSLEYNNLEGSIPASFGGLSSLKWLQLNGNMLSGTIPTELGGLVNLEWMMLFENQFSGGLPDELGNLDELYWLMLHDNQLTGEIPETLGNLDRLVQINLSDNQLSGQIPSMLGEAIELGALYLHNNNLTGPIPKELGELTELSWLDLGDNQLTGDLPTEFGNLDNLFFLNVSNNLLIGAIPLSFTGLTDLGTSGASFDFSKTSVCEPSDQAYQDWKEGRNIVKSGLICENGYSLYSDSLVLVALYESTDGENWTNNDNWLEGPLESWYGIFVENDSVTRINLGSCCDGNNLTGLIPAEIGNIRGLNTLNLSYNNLEGELPHSIANLENLRRLDLSSNDLSGELPQSFGNLRNLESVFLYDNSFNGSIPELSGLTQLIWLDFSENMLSGEIPIGLAHAPNLNTLNLSDNLLSGEIPSEFAALTHLDALILNNNGLVGNIPKELGELDNMRILELNQNQLTGSLPSELGSLFKLNMLEVSNNELSGSIPLSFTDLTVLGEQGLYFNFSNTDLCEPNDQTYQNWKEGRNIISSGLICDNLDVQPDFLTFTIPEQYEEPYIDIENDSVRIYVTCPDDLFFQPSFTTSGNSQAFINGELQISGLSSVDLTDPVKYTLVEGDEEAEWIVKVIKLNTIVGVEKYQNANYSCNDPNGGAGIWAINFDVGTSYNVNQGYSYEWSDDNFNSVISSEPGIGGLPEGDYQLRVTEDQNGCQITETFVVADSSQFFNIKATVVPQTSCEESNGGITPVEFSHHYFNYQLPNDQVTFEWSTGQSGTQITGLAAGTYVVQIEDNQSGCTFEKSFVVTEQALGGDIEITSLIPSTNCDNNNGAISIDINGSTSDYNFNWYMGSSATGTVLSSDPAISDLEAGQYTVKVTKSGQQCSEIQTIEVLREEPPALAIELSSKANTNCTSPNGEVSVSSIKVGGKDSTLTTGFRVEWSKTATFDAILSPSPSVTGLESGEYFARLVNTITGCISQVKSIAVADNQTAINFNLSTEATSRCDETGNGSATLTDVPEGTQITWYRGSALVPGETTESIGDLLVGDYQVRVKTIATGCELIKTFEITSSLPEITLETSTVDNTSCGTPAGEAEVIKVSVGGQTTTDLQAFSFEWWIASGNSRLIQGSSSQLQNMTGGEYYVQATLDSVGCQSVPLMVMVEEDVHEFTLDLTGNRPDLPGIAETGQLKIEVVDAPEAFEIAWYEGENPSGFVIGTMTTLDNVNAGNYTVKVTDTSTGCNAIGTYEVGVDERIAQAVSFTLVDRINVQELPLILTASSDQGLPVSFEIVEGDGEINQNALSATADGFITIRAYNDGNNEIAYGEKLRTIRIVSDFHISGRVLGAADGALVDGQVVVFDLNGDVIANSTFSNGEYFIDDIPDGSYHLLIEVTEEHNAVAFDTYYDGTVLLQEATTLLINDNTEIDISLVPKISEGLSGQGSITGQVTESNGGSRITVGRTLDGTPIAGISVYLSDRNTHDVLAEAITDQDGVFIFENVPTGQYYFRIDAVGYDIADLGADIDYDESEGVLEINAAIGQGSFEVQYAVVSGVDDELLKDIRIYPNPAKHVMHIEDAQNRIKGVQLMNLTGQLIKTFETNSSDQYDISTLTDGMYLIRIVLEAQQFAHAKIVIRH